MVIEIPNVDLWLLTIVPILLQTGATIYLSKIHGLIGRYATLNFIGFNVTMYLYDFIMLYALHTAGTRVGTGVIEVWALWLGLIFPTSQGILHFLFKYHLVRGLRPNRRGVGSSYYSSSPSGPKK